MKLKFTALILVAIIGFIQLVSAQTNIHTLKIKNTKQLYQYFNYKSKDLPLISGHRGGTTIGFPENCIATFENTLRYTPAFFEIDPRLTKDSVIVLMHDETLDRTTTGKGKVSDYTWEELQKFRLKDPQGNVTDFKIPLLKEVILWSKGKTVLNLDHKDVPLEKTAKLLKECGNDVIMLTVHKPEEAKFYLLNNPKRMFSAFILNKKTYYDYEKAGIPWNSMIAYIGAKPTPQNLEILNLLHAKGVMCMISAASSYDKLKDAAERTAAYKTIMRHGADILESDLPIQAAAAVKEFIPLRSSKLKFWSKEQ